MKISAIIFDIDGVLLDSNKLMIDLHKIIAKEPMQTVNTTVISSFLEEMANLFIIKSHTILSQ